MKALPWSVAAGAVWLAYNQNQAKDQQAREKARLVIGFNHLYSKASSQLRKETTALMDQTKIG